MRFYRMLSSAGWLIQPINITCQIVYMGNPGDAQPDKNNEPLPARLNLALTARRNRAASPFCLLLIDMRNS
jgi:hypothetical protein